MEWVWGGKTSPITNSEYSCQWDRVVNCLHPGGGGGRTASTIPTLLLIRAWMQEVSSGYQSQNNRQAVRQQILRINHIMTVKSLERSRSIFYPLASTCSSNQSSIDSRAWSVCPFEGCSMWTAYVNKSKKSTTAREGRRQFFCLYWRICALD